MSIATKTGDRGDTSLLSGERVRKDNLRVESYGTIDELSSLLGDAKHACSSSGFPDIIESIQRDLFHLCAELASHGSPYGDPLEEEAVERISGLLEQMEQEVQLTGFVLPGNSPGSAKLDICRSVARRGERRIISLAASAEVRSVVIKYVNRLSDLLFIMARKEEGNHKYVK